MLLAVLLMPDPQRPARRLGTVFGIGIGDPDRPGLGRRSAFLEVFVAFLQAFIFTYLTVALHRHVGQRAPRRCTMRREAAAH